jgi:hypothetical protein
MPNSYDMTLLMSQNELINVRENRVDNHEWIIQRHRQHWAQDKRKKNTILKTNKMRSHQTTLIPPNNTDPTKQHW